jgi:hypothetical protein
MYHDPTGVVRELDRLAGKYRDRPPDDSFAPDLGHWHVRLALMARQLGDRRTAVRLLRQGVARAGVSATGRHVMQRAARKLGRTTGHGATAAELAPEWLTAYGPAGTAVVTSGEIPDG